MQKFNESYKIIFVGDSGSGKTSIVNSYIEITASKGKEKANPEQNSPTATIGANQLTIYYKNSMMRIWDTAGQENYRAILPLYFKSSALAIFVFDITSRSSFEHITSSYKNSNSNQDDNNNKNELYEPGSWLDLVAQNTPKECKFIVVGNKTDLKDEREVSPQEGENLIRKINSYWKNETEEKAFFYIETSAVDNSNILEMFDQIYESKDCLMKKYISQEYLSTDDNKISESQSDNEINKSCC